jgi:hypothetical protein
MNAYGGLSGACTTPAIPTLRRQAGKSRVGGKPSYIVRFCLKNKQKNPKQNQKRVR